MSAIATVRPEAWLTEDFLGASNVYSLPEMARAVAEIDPTELDDYDIPHAPEAILAWLQEQTVTAMSVSFGVFESERWDGEYVTLPDIEREAEAGSVKVLGVSL